MNKGTTARIRQQQKKAIFHTFQNDLHISLQQPGLDKEFGLVFVGLFVFSWSGRRRADAGEEKRHVLISGRNVGGKEEGAECGTVDDLLHHR